MPVVKNSVLKIVINTISKRQQMQCKVKAYVAISFKTHVGRFSKQKRLSILQNSVFFVHRFTIRQKDSCRENFVDRCAN